MSPKAKAKLEQFARITVLGIVTQPLVAALISSALIRYPVAAAIVGVIETAVIQLFRPVQVTSESAPPDKSGAP